MTKIRKQTIQKTLAALQEFQAEISQKNGLVNSTRQIEICKKHKVNNNTICASVQMGVFTRESRGVFKNNIGIIDPFHARKVIEQIYKKPSYKKDNVVKPKAISKKKKQISLFWGLIKFSV